jgi:hypothetical protein
MSMDQWKNQGGVKYTENIDKITKDVRVAERKKTEAAVATAAPATTGSCCSGEGGGQGGSCGCGENHGHRHGNGKHEALVQILPELQ